MNEKKSISRAKLIKELRTKRGWPQKQLADISGISERTVQRIERGGAAALDTLQALASALEITVEELLPTEDPQEKKISAPNIFHLSRLHTGKDIINIISGSDMYQSDHDDINDQTKAKLIGDFLQEISDFGEIWDDIEPKHKIEISYSLNEKIKELEELGFWVFGIQRKALFRFNIIEEKKDILMRVGTIVLKRSNSPTIIKAQPGKEVFAAVFK